MSDIAHRPTRDPALVAVVLLAALLRFPTLSLQSYWDDEGTTVGLMRMGFFHMLSTLPHSESTPPLYYILAWIWSHVFGTGEAGLRSLSAAAGVGTVVLAHDAGRVLAGKTTGRIAAVLVAVNPLMIWYSQEARAYALAALFCAAGFLFFVRAVDPQGSQPITPWAVCSILALLTHYFSLFLIVPEAIWLLFFARHRGARTASARSTWVGVTWVGAVGAALLPLALIQRQRGYVFHGVPLAKRVAQVPEQFLIGYGIWYTTWGKLLALASAALLVPAAAALVRRSNRDWMVPGSVVFLACATPVTLALLGLDYVATLYMLSALPPLLTLIAIGLARRGRSGIAAAAALVAIQVAAVSVVLVFPEFQREDLRGAAEAIGTRRVARVLVVTPPSVLSAYDESLHELPAQGEAVSEIVVIGMAEKEVGNAPVVPRKLEHRLQIAGFHLVERDFAARFTLLRYRARFPALITRSRVWQSHLGRWADDRVSVLYEAGK